MRHMQIPRRFPPLVWRKPAFLWTPLALALAIGWPVLALQQEGGMTRLALVCGACAFAIGLLTLGGSWMIGRAPRTRRAVILHVVAAGALVALAAPFVLTSLLARVADYKTPGAGAAFTLPMSMAMVPLALLLGLPAAFISGVMFAMLALTKPGKSDLVDDEMFRRRDVQPFV